MVPTIYCAITSDVLNCFPEAEGHGADQILIKGSDFTTKKCVIMILVYICRRAHQPHYYHLRVKHYRYTVSWKSPGDPVTGYVIYYRSKSRAISSDIVSVGESHSLDGLQRGVTYNISIVAQSTGGPVIVISGELTVNHNPCHYY